VKSKTLRFAAAGFLVSMLLISASHAYVVNNHAGADPGYTVTYQHVTETPEPPGYGAVQNVGALPYAATPPAQQRPVLSQPPIQARPVSVQPRVDPGRLVAQAQNGSQLQPLPKSTPKKKSAKTVKTQAAPKQPRTVAANQYQTNYGRQSGPIMQGGYNQPAPTRYFANQYQAPISAPNYYQYGSWGSSSRGCVGGS
jgi:hypothetical protein